MKLHLVCVTNFLLCAQRNVVAYNEGQVPRLKKALVLGDTISDLPPVMRISVLVIEALFFHNRHSYTFLLKVSNDESGEEISYRKPPENEFQKFIRATRSG
ncbi:hypothetical protein Dimus_030581 [Dionaea muscipula]